MSEKDARLFQFPHVLIVEASAGSGKTYALAKRYTQLLINPYLKDEEIPLNTILAITFTNKAVGEMKERILEFFKKIALDKFSKHKEKADILSSLGVKEESCRKKAYRIMDELIRNYNFFQVQTIDSFINAILSGCAFKLNLSANFRTKEEYDEYLAYSLDKLIDKAAADDDIRALFGDFLRHYLFIEKRTGWFPKQNILGILSSLFSKSNRYAGRFLRNDIQAKDLLSRKKGILKTMAQLAANLPPGVNKIFSNKLSDFLSENEDTFDVDDLSIFFKNEDFPINKGSVLAKEIEKLWANIRKNIGQLCELESASLFNYYIDIFNNVLADLKAVSSKDDVLFLEALNKEAAGLFLEGSLTLPELYWRLATRFKHFLIDEFQDTSRLQWENLFMMIQEALSIDGSLFYVGDRKQAIYRFRGGEVSLIDSVKGRFTNLIERSLTVNYRSRREIVEFNNRIFSKENISRFLKQKQITTTKSGAPLNTADIDRIVDIFEGSRQTAIEDKPGGYVKAEFIDCKLRDERDRLIKDKVLKTIEDLSRRYPFKDIALLARKNDQVELLTSWLLEKDIPVESEKTLNIRQNSYIKELVSFLKFLSSPIDNFSFASFILGDIFAKASGLDAKKMQDFIFRHKPKDDQPAYLYREFRLEFPKVWDELIEEFFKSVGFVPLYELVISIFGRFKVMKNFYAYQGFFMRFLELIKEQEEDSPDISSFLEFFDEAAEDDLYVNVTESDSVKITTIHKAKGAEFRAVIVPFTEMNVRIESPVVISDADRDILRLMHIKKTYADFSLALERIYREEYIKSFIDELNGIYVAFTRAIDELYIFVSPRTQTGINLAAMLLPEADIELGEKPQQKKSSDIKHRPAVQIAPSEYKDWIHLLKEEFAGEDILLAHDKVLRGKILHCILSFIVNTRNQDKSALVEEALKKTAVQFPFVRDFKGFAADVGRLLENKKLKPFFDITGAGVYLEKEIIDSGGNIKRMDRLIVTQKEAIIIDYKSTREKLDTYQKQVGEYMKIIKQIYPSLKVRGFLIYLDDLSAEEVSLRHCEEPLTRRVKGDEAIS